MRAAPEGTITLLFTDIEGSTRLLARTGARYAELLAVHRRLLRQAFDNHAGYEVDSAGDAFCVAFGSAKEAAAAATEGQQALAGYDWPDGERIWVRIGLHTGEPDLVGDAYVGLDVHHAARVMAAGHGGQVLLSQATRDLLGDAMPVQDLGEHRLKDLSRPQRLYQLQIDGLPSTFPALKTIENRPTNLPVQQTSLIGRERELADVTALLRQGDVRLLTLTGPGGTGKTRLALQSAAELLDEFPGGVYFVSLAPVSDADLVIPTIAQTLGLREQPGQSPLETLIDHLAGKPMLLVLDNLEQVLPAAPEIAALLTAGQDVRVLATSRAPLRVVGEKLFAVPPLSLPDLASGEELVSLGRHEAVRLFVERAQAIRRDFAVTPLNGQTVAEICVRLDGLPLAIELAATRIAVLSPAAMLARLDRRLNLLTSGGRDVDERQRTLRATIAWSFDLLSDAEQTLFARLGVFVGGCRISAAEAVCDDGQQLGIDMLEGLASLVEKSLLRQRDDPDGEPRFWMLETIREYALEQLQARHEQEAVEESLARDVISLALQARREVRLAEASVWLARLEAEQHNIRFVLEWLIARDRGDDTARVIAGVWYFWLSQGLAREGIPIAKSAATLHYTMPLLRGETLVFAGELLSGQGRYAEAKPLKEQALAVFLEHGDPSEAAATLTDLGGIALAENDLAKARELHERSVTLREELGVPAGIAHALSGLADLELQAGRYDAARAASSRVVEIARATDARELLSGNLYTLAEVELRQGALSPALVLALEAVQVAGETENLFLIQATLDGLARVLAALGATDHASVLWGAAEAIRAEGGYVLWDQERHEESIAAARNAMDADEFDRKWEQGRRLNVEQAVAAAREGPP
jgi:predicted ATPase/class 3 adenylate cyclase